MNCYKLFKQNHGLVLAAVITVVVMVAAIATVPSGFITLNTACTDSAPAITFSPSTQYGTAGSTKTYTVSVRNNDPSACAASEYELSTSYCASGWTCSLIGGNIPGYSARPSISPGSTYSSTQLSVASPSNAQASAVGSASYAAKVKANYRLFEGFDAGTDIARRGWQTDTQSDWSITSSGELRDSAIGWLFSYYNYEVYTRKKFSDFSVSSRVMITGGDGFALVGGRYENANRWYAAYIDDKLDRVGIIVRSGSAVTPYFVSYPIQANRWYNVKFEAVGNTLKMYLNGALKKTITMPDIQTGFVFLGNKQVAAMYDDVLITSLRSGEGTAYYQVTSTALYDLTIWKPGTGQGMVRVAVSLERGVFGTTFTCDATCQFLGYQLPSGVVANITATPAGGSAFSGFSGDCTGTTCVLNMDSEKKVNATFEAPVAYTLRVNRWGFGFGNVTSIDPTTGAPDGRISCPDNCSYGYPSIGTSVTLKATAASGSVFVGWSSNVRESCETSGYMNEHICTFNLDGAKTVTAYFEIP